MCRFGNVSKLSRSSNGKPFTCDVTRDCPERVAYAEKSRYELDTNGGAQLDFLRTTGVLRFVVQLLTDRLLASKSSWLIVTGAILAGEDAAGTHWTEHSEIADTQNQILVHCKKRKQFFRRDNMTVDHVDNL